MYSGPKILRKWEEFNLVREGQTLLDYGCGAGSFTLPAARRVGRRGKVYALDCFHRQLKMVEQKLIEEGLTNVQTILSNLETGLPDESIDIIWIRGGAIVDITERLDPQIGAPENELRIYAPREAVDEVLEVASGGASLIHARIGDAVTVRPLGGK